MSFVHFFEFYLFNGSIFFGFLSIILFHFQVLKILFVFICIFFVVASGIISISII